MRGPKGHLSASSILAQTNHIKTKHNNTKYNETKQPNKKQTTQNETQQNQNGAKQYKSQQKELASIIACIYQTSGPPECSGGPGLPHVIVRV